jgi:hypothetical protein
MLNRLPIGFVALGGLRPRFCLPSPILDKRTTYVVRVLKLRRGEAGGVVGATMSSFCTAK